MFFVEPACGERDIVVTTSIWCMCLVHAYIVYARVRPSGFVWAITFIFMHGLKTGTVVPLEK